MVNGVYVKDGNSIRVDMSRLDPIAERLRAKVRELFDPDHIEHYYWMNAVKGATVGGDLDLLKAYERFISTEEGHDSKTIQQFVAAVRGNGMRSYRKVSSMTMEHFKAFLSIRDAIIGYQKKEYRRTSNVGARYLEREAYSRMVIEDPSRAPMMCSIILTHGWVKPKVMRSMLKNIDPSATMLSGGIL